MTSDQPENDDELLLGMRSGDEKAFLTLYRRRQRAIYRFALHMSGSGSVAEDITQDVFLALIRDASGYDPERGTLSGYLYGIARKLLLRHAEHGRLDVSIDSLPVTGPVPVLQAADDPLADLTRKERIELLRRSVLTLPPRYREAIVLCDLEEVNYADAAQIMGCPVGTVRSRLHRARALLIEKLKQERGPRGPSLIKLNPLRSLS
jgi:RNA polymerase sigma-70 factor, ECF subfamily